MSELAFVRYDPETGAIRNCGHMGAEFVLDEQAAGHPILIVPEAKHISYFRNFRVDIGARELVSFDAPPEERDTLGLQIAIASALRGCDHYFLTDSEDNITAEEKDAWRQYRSALRAANKLLSFDDILASLPLANPKGLDAFHSFR
jgi:hypothetical protein